MPNPSPLTELRLWGYKSIRELKLKLRPLNVFVGSNGAGKSNLISFFGLLNAVVNERLQAHVIEQGAAAALAYYGLKTTDAIKAQLFFRNNGYFFELKATADDRLYFASEQFQFKGDYNPDIRTDLGSGHPETKMNDRYRADPSGVPGYVVPSLKAWKVYHFHDTSPQAAIKRKGQLRENEELHANGGNLAAFLYLLKTQSPGHYEFVRRTVQRIFPRFDDYALRPDPFNEDLIALEWREAGSDYRFGPHQLSDGTIRFMALATLLLQPRLPATVLIDEPELGLHPAALRVLGGLIRSASARTQILMTTQSVTLLSEFVPEDVVVVERVDGASTYERLDADALKQWLTEFSLGEVWESQVIGGQP